jgi:Raf kinase inhibitor-like YbhB/YbcL family protein
MGEPMTSPYDTMPAVPEFTVTSADTADGVALQAAQFAAMSGAPGAEDRSPQLSWDGFPAATRSFVVTMYDPDAPTPSGFWHWAVADIAVGVTSLDAGAGNGGLPDGAFHVPNDARATAYTGAAPPPGTGKHRYYIAVSALGVPSVTALGITPESTPAALSFFILQHTLARAVLVAWAGQ